MSDLWNDIKHALRMFAKNPGFTFAAIAALALGIGANTAIFSVVNTVLLKPLTYPDASRIMLFEETSPQGSGPGANVPEFHLWEKQSNVLYNVAAYDYNGPGFNITGDRPELIHGIHVTQRYFALFGAPIILGRTFTQQEDSPNGGHVVVISYGLWQRRFGGDPNIIGKALPLGNEPYTILGVVGKSFHTESDPDIWLPFQFQPNSTDQGHYFMVSGRLKPGVTIAQANAQLTLAADQYRRQYPNTMGPKDSFGVTPLRDFIVSDVRSSLFVLLGAVAFVLLIACANVANLLLVRATGRKREFAIRAAMGAGRARIIRQLLTESIMLAVAGGALGLALGFFGVRALLAINPGGIPRIGKHGAAVSLDPHVLLFTLGVAVLTGILFGLIPAIGAARPDLNTTLKESSNRSGTGFRQSKGRSLLVISEVSLALVLLIGAALLIRTYIALRNVNPGFDPHHVLTMQMSLTGAKYEKTAGVAELIRDARQRINAIPGVEDSAASCCLPLEGGFGLPFNIVGRPTGKSPYTGGAGWMSASPGYFSVFKIPIIEGRAFNHQDSAGAPGVVIINEALAKHYWPKQNPVGQQIIIGKGVGAEFNEPAREIIGVVGSIRDGGLNRDPRPLMIVPSSQVTDGVTALNNRIGPIAWIIRTHGDPHQYISAITSQLRQASDGFPVAHVRTMDEIVIRSTSRQDFNMLLLTIFGAAALILAAIGIYGLMAYSVQQRTQEMGIRMALGADRKRIRNLVVRQGMLLAVIGVVIGTAAAFGLARFLTSFLYGVKAWDPTVFIAVPIILATVALFATWIPAQRASKLDPMAALRVE